VAKEVRVIIIGNASSATAAFAKTSAAAGSMSARLATAGKTMTAIGTRMSTVGRSMTRYVSLPIVAAGAAAVHLATDFESSMSKIEGLVGVSSKQVSAWSDQILNMGQTLPQAPKELADALFFVTSAGFRGAEAMDVLTMSAKAAAAGLGETQTVADAVTSAVNSYAQSGLTAAEATDIMVAAVRTGKMPADALAGVLGGVLPVASQLGVGFDEVAAAIASATRQGLEASRAATGLRFMLMSLMKPTAETTATLRDYGLSISEVQKSLAERGLLATLTELADKFDLSTTRGREAFATIVGGARGFTAASILVGQNAEAVAGVFDDVTNAVGSTNKAFEVASQTAGFKFRQALTQLEDAAIELGNIVLPILTKDVIPAIQGAIKWFSDLSPATKELALKLLFFAACAGPLLRVAGALFKVAGGLLKFAGAMTAANVAGGVGGAGAGAGAGAAGGLAALGTRLLTFIGTLGLAADAYGIFKLVQIDLQRRAANASREISEARTGVLEWVLAVNAGVPVGTAWSNTIADMASGAKGALATTAGLRDAVAKLQGALTAGRISADDYDTMVALLSTSVGGLGFRVRDADTVLSDFTSTTVGAAAKAGGLSAALDAMADSTDPLSQSIHKVIGKLQLWGVHLSKAQKFTLKSYLATGDLSSALILLQSIAGNVKPIDKHKEAERRAAEQAGIWSDREGDVLSAAKAVGTGLVKNRGAIDQHADAAKRAGDNAGTWAQREQAAGGKTKWAALQARLAINPIDALTKSTGFLLGPLQDWAYWASQAALAQIAANQAAANFHPPSGAPPGGGKDWGQPGRPILPNVITGIAPVVQPQVNVYVAGSRLERRQFARGLDQEYASRGW